MKSGKQKHRPKVSRTVHYEIDLQKIGRHLTDEAAVEKILAAHPDVTCFDTSRGWLVWWDVKPGASARALRKRLEALCAERSEERPGEREYWLRHYAKT